MNPKPQMFYIDNGIKLIAAILDIFCTFIETYIRMRLRPTFNARASQHNVLPDPGLDEGKGGGGCLTVGKVSGCEPMPNSK